MDSSQWKSKLSIPKILLFSLSVVSLLIGAGGATAHYLRWSWGNRAHPVGWLLGMLFLLLALLPQPRELAASLKSLIRPENGVPSVLDPLLCSFAPVEFQYRAVERERTF